MGSRAAAESDPATLNVVFQGDGRGCLSERALRRRIAHYFADANSQHGGFDIHVRVRADGQTEFELERGGSSVAVRTFPTLPEACAERVDAIAIAIAIAMEQADSTETGAIAAAAPASTSTQASPAEAPETTPPDDAPPVSADEARVEVPPEQVRRDTPASKPGEKPAERYSVRVGAGILFRFLPSPVGVALVGGDIAIGGGPLYVSVAALLSGQTRDELATGIVKAQLAAGRGALCYRGQVGWATLCACPGLAIGGYLTHGEDYDTENRDANLPWVAAFGHAGLRVFDGGLKLELSVEGYFNLVRPRLWVEGTTDEFTTPIFAISSIAELLVVF